ncbi:MAG: hypothetical protein WBO17_03120, partial [Sphingorhabdus sp.]
QLTHEQATALFKNLPREADAIANRIVEVLSARGLLSDDPEIQNKASNLLKNDRTYLKLTRR